MSKIAEGLATGVHRAIVIDHDGKLKNIITQSAIVVRSEQRNLEFASALVLKKILQEFLFQHRRNLTDILEKSIFELDLGAKEVLAVKTSDLVIDAFRQLVTHKVTAVGVVNHEGVLIGNISSRDLRVRFERKRALHSCLILTSLALQTAATAKDTVKYLYSPVAEFLAAKRSNPNAPATAVACKPNDSFGTLLEKIHINKIHRVYVVNEHFHPIGVVALKEVLELFSRIEVERKHVLAETILHQTISHGPLL